MTLFETVGNIKVYTETKKVNETEYNPLLEELKSIYDDCILVVKQRLCYDDLVNKAWK